jgi:hypothetical protein
MNSRFDRSTEIHNLLAREIVSRIVKGVLENGGSSVDVMVLTETVLVGVALTCIRLGGDDRVLDTMIDGARKRLAEIRLLDVQPGGTA